jgi:predicted transcriptional regulator
MINDDKPHTADSIAKMIGTTQQSVKLKLKSLEKIGAIHHGIMKENKRLGKVYIVNPHIIRKGHKMKQSLGTTFDEIKRQY